MGMQEKIEINTKNKNLIPPELQLFQLYSKNDEIQTKDLLKLLRFLGHTMDPDSLTNLIKNESIGVTLNYEEFALINKKAKNYNIQESSIRKSFEYFDPQKTGFIPISVLEEIFPDPKNGEISDVEEIIRLLEQDEHGRINYESFLRRVYGGN